MPNTRRRRFSVQNEMESRELPKSPHPLISQSTKIEPDLTQRSKSKPNQNNSKQLITTLINEDITSMSVIAVKNQSNPAVSACSFHTGKKDSTEMLLRETAVTTRQISTDKLTDSQRTSSRRNKLSRQHRVKVRSPHHTHGNELHRFISKGTENIIITRNSTGTDPLVVSPGVEAYTTNFYCNLFSNDEDDRRSNQSNDDICRICHGGESLNSEQGSLISACACRGTVGRVHVKCLERWLTESGKSRCELCSTRYATKRVHRYGVLKALVMWILSQNAKQLLVDSLGIMLMSPLAVLAAWLSGRTLAGLMMDNHTHIAPWPLASTFVLACLTLVCYYCWIVSAATRHALGWWIWYRSQYEVRLELQDTEN